MPKAKRDEDPLDARCLAEIAPGGEKIDPRFVVARAGGVACFLLPQRDQVEHDGDHRGALHDLDQLELVEACKEGTKAKRADQHSNEQHDVKKGDDTGALFFRREVCRQREAGGLGGVEAGADEQESKRCAEVADPGRPGGVAGEQDDRKRHDREAAELQQRSHPDVGNTAPAEIRAVGVRLVPDQGAQRRKNERQ